MAGAAWVAACQLAYVSGVMNTAALILALALVALARRRPKESGCDRGRGHGTRGAAVAVALYYRDFLGMAFDLVPRVAQGRTQAPSRYPIQPFLVVAYARTRDFFDTIYPVLAAAGLALLWRKGTEPRRPPHPPRRAPGDGFSWAGWAPMCCCWPAERACRTCSSTATRRCS